MAKLFIALATVLCLTIIGQSVLILSQLQTISDLKRDTYEQGIEQKFLARKMQELKGMNEKNVEGMGLQVKFAVVGFRTGSYGRYVEIRDEAIKNGILKGAGL